MAACSDSNDGDADGGAGSPATGGSSQGSGGAPGQSGGTGGDGGAAGSGGIEEPPRIPEFVSISGDGCGFISPRNQIFPICRVNAEDREIADGNTFQIECLESAGGAPVLIDGTITDGSFSLASDSFTGSGRWAVGDNTTLRCSATQGIDQTQEITCSQEGEDKVATCVFRPFEEFRADVGCVDLPATFDSVQSGSTSLSSCQVAQDGYNFQAVCEEGSFRGMIGPEGVYNVTLSEEATNCRTNERTAGTLSGVCNISDPLEITFSETEESCGQLLDGSPTDPHFFALALSCDDSAATPLARGVLGNEPTCAYRQNGCNWEVHCVRQEDGGKWDFSGTLKPGATKASFSVGVSGGPSGSFSVPCEFGATDGKFTGVCAVPTGNATFATCALSEVANPAADTARCEDISGVDFEDFSTHGCGPVSASCKVGLQHGCSFIAACDFSSFQGELMSGTVGKGQDVLGGDRDVLEFNGVGGYQCKVQKVLESEIGEHPVWRKEDPNVSYTEDVVNTLTRHVADEWYGTCQNPAIPHICRGTQSQHGGANPTAYQGLRLFFGERACGLSSGDACQ